MRDPGWSLRRSIQSFQMRRTRENPSVTINRKIRMEMPVEENKDLLGVIGAEEAQARRETKRALPHDQRYGKKKKNRAETVKNTLGHGKKLVLV